MKRVKRKEKFPRARTDTNKIELDLSTLIKCYSVIKKDTRITEDVTKK